MNFQGTVSLSNYSVPNLGNISCPGCGRTLYDLESTIARIKAATSHLKGLKIGIMGCIVNGPGEMADADYGYVGPAGTRSACTSRRCVWRRTSPKSRQWKSCWS